MVVAKERYAKWFVDISRLLSNSAFEMANHNKETRLWWNDMLAAAGNSYFRVISSWSLLINLAFIPFYLQNQGTGSCKHNRLTWLIPVVLLRWNLCQEYVHMLTFLLFSHKHVIWKTNALPSHLMVCHLSHWWRTWNLY